MLSREISYPKKGDSTALLQRPKNELEGPIETMNLTLELDATDNLEKPEQHPHTVENGLLPSLAVLESMIATSEFPVIIFQWGQKRMIPVRLISYKITEEVFDQSLNPIRAKIDICMQVLRSSDFKSGSVGHKIYENFQMQKEALALLYRAREEEKAGK